MEDEVGQGKEREDDMSEEDELKEEVEGRLVEERLLVSALECPVCLALPHSPPVYTCRVGTAHLIRNRRAFLLSRKMTNLPNHIFTLILGWPSCLWPLLEKSVWQMSSLSHPI